MISNDLFTCRPNTKYFQTLSGEKWRSFANSLRSMLKFRSTLHQVTWHLKIWHAVQDWCLAGHATIAYWPLFSPNRSSKRTELTEIVLNHGFRHEEAGYIDVLMELYLSNTRNTCITLHNMITHFTLYCYHVHVRLGIPWITQARPWVSHRVTWARMFSTIPDSANPTSRRRLGIR